MTLIISESIIKATNLYERGFELQMLYNTGNRKLIAALILFVIALFVLYMGIFVMIVGFFRRSVSVMESGVAPIISGSILIMVSGILNLLYRNNYLEPSTLSTVLLIVMSVAFFPSIIIAIAAMPFSSAKYKSKRIKVKDEAGKKFILMRLSAENNNYVDPNGDRWFSRDDGKTFERC